MTKLEMEAKLRDIRAHTLLALVENIDQWGVDRNITREGGATAQMQISKLIEELAECVATLGKISANEYEATTEFGVEDDDNTYEWKELQDTLKDDYGDMLACLLQAMRLSDTDIIECLGMAWNDIKDRKGTMVNGKFIKEADLSS